MSTQKLCPICNSPNSKVGLGAMQEKRAETYDNINCPACGNYTISSQVAEFGFDHLLELQDKKHILRALHKSDLEPKKVV